MQPPRSAFNFIIGASKCGTTALFDALKRHPEIHTADVKEPNFFSKDTEYNRGVSAYLERFLNWDAGRHQMALDAFDDLRARPGHVVSAVLSHFGLPPNEAVSIVPSHRSSLLYSTHFIKRALVDRALIAEGASTSVAVQMFRSLPLYEQKVVIRSAEEYYIPSAELQQRMRSILAPEMEMLHKEYGIDVSTWGF